MLRIARRLSAVVLVLALIALSAGIALLAADHLLGNDVLTSTVEQWRLPSDWTVAWGWGGAAIALVVGLALVAFMLWPRAIDEFDATAPDGVSSLTFTRTGLQGRWARMALRDNDVIDAVATGRRRTVTVRIDVPARIPSDPVRNRIRTMVADDAAQLGLSNVKTKVAVTSRSRRTA